MKKEITFSAIALGISSLLTQLVFLREALNIFSGNELTLGIVFSAWLLCIGFGSRLKDSIHIKREKDCLIVLLLLLSILPILLLFSMRYVRANFFTYGISLDLFSTFTLSFGFLFPYCLLSGFLLPFLCSLVRKDERGKVYWLDSIGDLTGALLFTLLLIFLPNAFQILFLNLWINLSAVFYLSWKWKKRKFLFLSSLVLISSLIFLSIDINKLSLSFLYKNQEIVYAKDSLYGNLVVTRTADQLNFFEDFILLFSTQNEIEAEEVVHYAMCQPKSPENVLLLSGGISGTLKEILKYQPRRVDYVELDPEILKVGKMFGRIPEDSRINLITTDARFYVKNTDRSYDVIIVDLPDPSTVQLNRFYTLEFFRELKRILRKGGVVSLSISSQENYMNPETRRLNSIIFRTLREVFSHVIIIPGEENYFIASDSELTYEIGKRIREKGIETQFVNEEYLSGKLTKERIDYVMKSLEEDVEVNRDFEPVAYYHYLKYWLSQFNLSFGTVTTLFFLSFLLSSSVMRLSPTSFAIFTTGIAATGMEMLLLLVFQSVYGYLYSMLAVLITLFMIGISCGSFLANRVQASLRKTLTLTEFILFLLCLFPSFFINLIAENPHLIPFLIFSLGFFTGFEFPIATLLEVREGQLGNLFFADMFGGFVGSLLPPLFLFPLIGLAKTCLIIALFNLLTTLLTLSLIRRKKKI